MTAILDLPEIRERVFRWPVAKYREMTEDNPAFRRCELIRGIIIDRPPRPPRQSFLTARFHRYLLAAVDGQHLSVWQYGPMELADSVPEPDVSVVRGVPDDFRTCHPTTAELVVEVAVGNAALDRENATLYAEADVTEYWIVLAEAEQVEVYRRPESGVYQEKRTYARGEVIEGVSVTGAPVAVETFFRL